MTSNLKFDKLKRTSEEDLFNLLTGRFDVRECGMSHLIKILYEESFIRESGKYPTRFTVTQRFTLYSDISELDFEVGKECELDRFQRTIFFMR